MVTSRTITADDLLNAARGERCELIDGKLRSLSRNGGDHGWIAMKLGARLLSHVEANGLGRVYAAETGFLIERDPDTVRAADVAFVHRDRVPEPGVHRGFLPLAPDLIVEVVSPGDRVGEVHEKFEAWIRACVKMVWIVWPNTRTVDVQGPDLESITLRDEDSIDGQDVVPGFCCKVGDVFT